MLAYFIFRESIETSISEYFRIGQARFFFLWPNHLTPEGVHESKNMCEKCPILYARADLKPQKINTKPVIHKSPCKVCVKPLCVIPFIRHRGMIHPIGAFFVSASGSMQPNNKNNGFKNVPLAANKAHIQIPKPLWILPLKAHTSFHF